MHSVIRPMEIEKQIAFDKEEMGSFQRMSLKKVSSKITAATYDFRRSLDEDFVRFESYLEAEIW